MLGASLKNLIETYEDADRISIAAAEAEGTQKPVAVPVGSEFGG